MKNIINAIVTGGASGLGEATVREVIKNSGQALIMDSDEEKARTLIKELGESCIFFKTDVTNENSIKSALHEGISKFKNIHDYL